MNSLKTYKIILSLSVLPAIAGINNTTAQELSTYLEQAVANNPEIKAYELRYNLAQEKSAEVNTFPDTEFAAGYFVSTPETRTGAQRARFSVKQMLPWFGTVDARIAAQNAMAEAEYADYVIAKRKLELKVAQSYYVMYGLKAKMIVLQQNKELLKSYEELALSAVEVGKASAVDFLKIQIRQNELEAQRQMLDQELTAAEIQFYTLLNTEESAPIRIVDSLIIPFSDPEVSLEALLQNPELLKYDRIYESIASAEALNQREAAPKFGVGLDYIPVSERTDVMLPDNGKDIVMPMLSVSVPIFNNKYKSVTRQNELRQQELAARRSQRLNLLRSLFAEAQKNRNTARIQYDTQEQNLKQARDAESILLKNYETGTIDFSEVLDIQEMQLSIQTKQIEAVQRYYEQAAVINYLTLF
ncbi:MULTISPECIES: TolC family protein [unclassified Leeuwenhoekiella]|uniref:TolC family protein n=1 Tax=unclassified Leeuwenhoekiella TaxID=2615029 RepID=UPI000C62E004|nr:MULTISPECIES: TolC family protein [unclassified Leeuwenhoekiella]MAW95592.1 transporter [Leeuwenhoekiella sp.]MBA82316.1 transporter [Leeuwenhoekiella sp.]|tara:strand:- start:23401 stop:24645 length:1245 start_codon:yes stop_codon:yes gene_type:complete